MTILADTIAESGLTEFRRCSLRKSAFFVLLLGCCVLALPLASTGVSDASPKVLRIATMDAQRILTAMLADANQQKSCTSTSTSLLSGLPFRLVTDSSTKVGEQFLSYDGAAMALRVLKGIVYVYANRGGLFIQFGVKEPQFVDTWIEVTPTFRDYPQMQGGVLLASMLAELPPTGALTTTKVVSVHGERAVAIMGKPNNRSGFSSGKETIYVSAKAPYLPIEVTITAVTTGNVRDFEVTFAHWGKVFQIVKPADAVPVAELKVPS
jgi:hypothetical protein